jgi:hypothetical protein
MPSVIFEDDLVDTGSAILGGSRVLFVAWEITTRGPNVRIPNSWDTDTIIGAGHWSLGNDLTPGGLISGLAFDSPHWLYADAGQWVAPPGQIGSDFSAAIAQYIRWSFAPGTEVHLYVFGDA